jgi:hypothetical protein
MAGATNSTYGTQSYTALVAAAGSLDLAGYVRCAAADVFTFTGKAYLAAAGTGTASIAFYDSTFLMIGSYTIASITTTSWAAFSVTATAPTNAVYVKFGLASPAAATLHAAQLVAIKTSDTTWNAAGESVVHTRGWTANQAGLLVIGDYIQLGYRLHKVLADVASNSDGTAAISIWPSLREAQYEGQPVILTSTQGLWCLAENKRDWSQSEARFYGIAFQIAEAK